MDILTLISNKNFEYCKAISNLASASFLQIHVGFNFASMLYFPCIWLRNLIFAGFNFREARKIREFAKLNTTQKYGALQY